MLNLNKLKNLTLFLLTLLISISCGGSDSKSANNESGQGGSDSNPSNNSINDMPGGIDLSTAVATIKSIANVDNIQKVDAIWLQGAWASFTQDGRSEKLTFKADNSYQYESTLVDKDKTTISTTSGKWVVYEKVGTQKYHLYLTNNDNPLQLEDYPIELEGNDALRVIYQYKTVSRSSLYSRMSVDFAVYPGMNFIGTFTQNFAYRTGGVWGDDHSLSFKFMKDCTLIYSDYIQKIAAENELFSTITGTWQLDTINSKLIITLENTDFTYSINSANYRSLSLVDKKGNKTYWTKTTIHRHDATINNMEGEYQSQKEETYFSIKKVSDGYIVDYVSDTLEFTSFKNVPAEQLDNGDLRLFYPSGHNSEGKEIILRAGYNRIIAMKGFSVIASNIQKVSKYPITKNPSSVSGGWRNTIFSANGFLNYLNFYNNGIFKDTDSYGKYTFDGNKLVTHRTCKKSKVFYPSFSDHKLDLNIPFSPVPGLRDWGEEGAKIGGITFKHALDAYQQKNSPKLKAHPSVKGGYLFASNVKFSALVTYGDYISYRLNSNGTGTYHAGFLGQTGYDFSDSWVEIPGSSLSFQIKYFIKQEDGKEYIVYYPDGLVLVNNDGKFTTIDEIKNANKDVRSVELYHRRTSICDEDIFVVPLSK